MALMFANKGLQRGLKMTILMNVEEVQLAVKTFEAPANTQNGKSVQELLKMFMTNQYQHRYRSMLKKECYVQEFFLS